MDLKKELKVGDEAICAGGIVVVDAIDSDYIRCKTKNLTYVVRHDLIIPLTKVMRILLCH